MMGPASPSQPPLLPSSPLITQWAPATAASFYSFRMQAQIPQDLCTCCLLHWKCSFSKSSPSGLGAPSRTQFKWHLLGEAFPDPLSTSPQTNHSSPLLLSSLQLSLSQVIWHLWFHFHFGFGCFLIYSLSSPTKKVSFLRIGTLTVSFSTLSPRPRMLPHHLCHLLDEQ